MRGCGANLYLLHVEPVLKSPPGDCDCDKEDAKYDVECPALRAQAECGTMAWCRIGFWRRWCGRVGCQEREG